MNNTNSATILERLQDTLQSRQKADSSVSYSAGLLQRDEDILLKKIIEEAGEVVLAAKSGDKKQLLSEMADLWFHCLIVMTRYNIPLSEVLEVLVSRQGVSGLTEKASR